MKLSALVAALLTLALTACGEKAAEVPAAPAVVVEAPAASAVAVEVAPATVEAASAVEAAPAAK